MLECKAEIAEEAGTSAETEEDPIVKEIPVFHSKRLEDNLYIFQYPLRPRDSRNEMNIRKCFVKPQNQQVKLEVGIDLDSSNVDDIRAQAIAKEVNSAAKNKEKETVFENGIMDKVTHVSSRILKDCSGIAVGAFNGRELHVTSLKAILQLRPSFTYVDKTTKRKRDADAALDSEDEEAGPSAAEQVTVKFKKTAPDLARAGTSFNSLQKMSEEEKWVSSDYHAEDSTFSELERLKLFTDNAAEDAGQALDLPDASYVKVLVPEDKEQSMAEPCLPSNVVSLHALRALPLQEQCKLLLKDAKIIQFNQLMMLLAGGEGLTADSLLKTLPKVAVLVQGNWIVKSEILYPAGTFSGVSGVPADLMCRARDYVLLLFKRNQYVERKKVSSVIRIPAEEVKEIFTGIAKLRHNRGWELALNADQDFISKHQDTVNRQHLMWEQRAKQVSDYFKDNKKQRRKSRSASEGKSDARDCGVSSDNDSGTEKAYNKSPVRKNKVNNNSKVSGDKTEQRAKS